MNGPDLHGALVAPVAEFAFMRRALVAGLSASLVAGPIGTMLVLRRMSLVGDAMSHALLPGAAIGFLATGMSFVGTSAGAFVAAIVVAALAGMTSRATRQHEDASFAAFYLVALALGVVVVARRGSAVDLMHVLFGNVLAVDDRTLLASASVATVVLLGLASCARGLLIDCIDPLQLRLAGRRSSVHHAVFLVLVVLVLVAGFQTFGTLMSIGIVILPAIAARYWTNDVFRMAALASVIAMACVYVGLLASWHFDLPSGPTIVLCAGVVFAASACAGTVGSVLARSSRAADGGVDR